MNAVDVEAIQHWLVTHLAELLDVDPLDIDVRQPFTEYGLDSITGMCFAGDLQDWLGLRLDPTLLWDYPVIETLAQYLTEAIACRPAGLERQEDCCRVNLRREGEQTVGQGNTKQWLGQLDDLADADVDALLASLLVA